MAIKIGNSSLDKYGRVFLKSKGTLNEAIIRKIVLNEIVIWEKEDEKMRKTCLFGNWKMNLTLKESLELVDQLKPLINQNRIEVALAPSFVNISGVHDALEGTNIKLIAQDVSDMSNGPYTGQVSARQLAAVGVEFVFINHNEVRKYIYNSDLDQIDYVVCNREKAKIRQCLDNGLTPIIFVGESLKTHEAGETSEFLKLQLNAILSGFSADEVQKCILCYEPIWATGTGKICTPDQADEIIGTLRQHIGTYFSLNMAEKMQILFGGSAKPSATAEWITKVNLDGFAAGGISLRTEFAEVLNEMEKYL